MIRERIVQAAVKLFIQNGVRNVTMTDIAVHLGMSKRTIYEHVKNKEELIEACVVVMEHEKHEELDRLDMNEKMIVLIKYFIDISTGVIESDLGVFIMEVKKYHPEVFSNTIGKNREMRFKNTVEFIEKGIDEGFFLKKIDAKLMALLISNMFTTFEKNDDLLGFDKRQMPEVFKSIFLLMCRGMATRHGVDELDRVFV